MTLEELQQLIPREERREIGLQVIAELFPNIKKEEEK